MVVTYSDLMRYKYRKEHGSPRFNIIGFSMSSPWRPSKSCVICHVILIPGVNVQTGEKISGLTCPKCGMNFSENERTATQEGLTSKHTKQETRIISAKSSKKHYDSFGNLINDETLLNDITKGSNVIYYNETKSGEDTIVDSGNRRIIKSRK